MELARIGLVAAGLTVNRGVELAEVLQVQVQVDFAYVLIAVLKYHIKLGSPVMKLSAHSAERL